MEDVCLVELGQGLFARHLLEGTSALSRADVDRADDGWWEHLAAELLAAVEDTAASAAYRRSGPTT